MIINKALVIALALWVGTANFAYASAKVECAGMMMSSHSNCTEKSPCQCSIQTPSNEQALPVNTEIRIQLLQAGLPIVNSEALAFINFHSINNPFESPPKQPPLYQLFSVYRL